jgi:hypothetical protein
VFNGLLTEVQYSSLLIHPSMRNLTSRVTEPIPPGAMGVAVLVDGIVLGFSPYRVLLCFELLALRDGEL